MKKADKEFDLSQVIGGALDIFGVKLDLGKLLSSPDEVRERLDALREKLKQAGGKETQTDEEWRQGVSVRGHVKTHGVLGEREYHIGTGEKPAWERRPTRKPPEPPEVVEPAVDVFDEAKEIVVVAEVPGVGLNDLELKVQDKVLSLSTKSKAGMNYRKDIELSSEVDADTLRTTWRNGILEIRLRKKDGKGE